MEKAVTEAERIADLERVCLRLVRLFADDGHEPEFEDLEAHLAVAEARNVLSGGRSGRTIYDALLDPTDGEAEEAI